MPMNIGRIYNNRAVMAAKRLSFRTMPEPRIVSQTYIDVVTQRVVARKEFSVDQLPPDFEFPVGSTGSVDGADFRIERADPATATELSRLGSGVLTVRLIPDRDGMREIVCPGGVAKFRLPADWTVELDAAEGPTFHRPGSPGWLHLTILTFQMASGRPVSSYGPPPLPKGARHLDIGTLPNGCATHVSQHKTVGDGTRRRMRRWRIFQVVEPYQRLFQFQYSYDPPERRVADELRMLDKQIRAMDAATAP